MDNDSCYCFYRFYRKNKLNIYSFNTNFFYNFKDRYPCIKN